MEEGKMPEEGKAPEEKPEEKPAGEEAQAAPPPPPAPPKKKAKWPIVLLIVLLICCVVSVVAGTVTIYIGKQAAEKGVSELEGTAKIQACKANQRMIVSSAEAFKATKERYPASLDELKGEYGTLTTKCPLNNAPYDYDSTTGKVTCPNGHTID